MNTDRREWIRRQAITIFELTKGFTPEQRQNFSNELTSLEEMSGYVLELTDQLKQRDETIIIEAIQEYADSENERLKQENKELKEALRDILPLAEQYIHYLGYQPIQPKQDREELIKIHSAEIETIRKLLTK